MALAFSFASSLPATARLYADPCAPLVEHIVMINGSVHFGVCHDFYVGKAPFIVSNTTSLRLDIIEAVNFVPSALFMLWLLVTLPWAIKRFYNAQKGQLGIIAYFALIWATALFRGLRFVILWAFMHGDAPSNLTTVEGIMYMMYLSCALTVEAAFLVRPPTLTLLALISPSPS